MKDQDEDDDKGLLLPVHLLNQATMAVRYSGSAKTNTGKRDVDEQQRKSMRQAKWLSLSY